MSYYMYRREIRVIEYRFGLLFAPNKEEKSKFFFLYCTLAHTIDRRAGVRI